MSEEYQKNVGFVGGVSLLVASITGPGLVTIPYLFQQAGWLLPIIAFCFIMFLTGVGALFLVEALTKYPGNGKFDKNIEITTLVKQFYGERMHNFMQVALYFSMQSVNIASIIISIQTFDNILIVLFGQTCGFGLYPRQEWICVHQQTDSSSPFTNDYMLVTLGYAVLLVFVVPLASMRLTDNILIQFISLVATLIISLEWVDVFGKNGFNADLMPVIGHDLSQIVGSIMFNYAFITTVPSWLNSKHPSVPVKKTIWVSLIMATLIYVVIGLTGGSSFHFSDTSNIMSVINSSSESSASMQFANFMFPVMSLIISIPVYIIIVRVNLVQSKVCGKSMATFLSSILPFFIVVPFQTGAWINGFMNWTSLIFTSTTNFIFPYLIYIFLARRKEFRDADNGEDNEEGGVDFLDYDLAINTIQNNTVRRTTETSLNAIGDYRLGQSHLTADTGGSPRSTAPGRNMIAALAKSKQVGTSRVALAMHRSASNLRSRKSLLSSAVCLSRELAEDRTTNTINKNIYTPQYRNHQESASEASADENDANVQDLETRDSPGFQHKIVKNTAMLRDDDADEVVSAVPTIAVGDGGNNRTSARQPAELTPSNVKQGNNNNNNNLVMPQLMVTPPSRQGSTQDISPVDQGTVGRPLIDFDSPSMAAGLEQLDRDREVLAQHRKHEESSRSPLPPIGENEFISSTTNFKPSSSSSSSANKNAIVPFDARTGVVGKKPVKRRNSTKKRRKKKHSEYSPLPGWLQSYISPITMAIVCCTLMSILVVGTIIYAAISTS